jgi:translation initiation factor IF-3
MYYQKREAANDNFRTRVNEGIRCPTIMLIDHEDRNLGIKSPYEALQMARAVNLDLVEVAANAKPPVCRIMDFGKYKYEQKLKEKEAKKNQKNTAPKELKLSPTIGDHDLETKLKSAREFLEEGHRVIFTLVYKKRQNAHKDLGFKVLEKIITALADAGTPQKQPALYGSQLSCCIEPKSK